MTWGTGNLGDRKGSAWSADLRIAARWSRRCRREKGAILLEFALVFPILLVFTLFLYELCLYWEGTILSNHAAFAVARIGKVHYKHSDATTKGSINWPDVDDCILSDIQMDGIEELKKQSNVLPKLVAAFYLAPATSQALTDETEIDEDLGDALSSGLQTRVVQSATNVFTNTMTQMQADISTKITDQIEDEVDELAISIFGTDVVGLIVDPALNWMQDSMVTPMVEAATEGVIDVLEERLGSSLDTYLSQSAVFDFQGIDSFAGRLNQAALRMSGNAASIRPKSLKQGFTQDLGFTCTYPKRIDGTSEGIAAAVSVEIDYPVKSDWFSLLAMLANDQNAKVGEVRAKGRYAMLAELQTSQTTMVDGEEVSLWTDPEPDTENTIAEDAMNDVLEAIENAEAGIKTAEGAVQTTLDTWTAAVETRRSSQKTAYDTLNTTTHSYFSNKLTPNTSYFDSANGDIETLLATKDEVDELLEGTDGWNTKYSNMQTSIANDEPNQQDDKYWEDDLDSPNYEDGDPIYNDDDEIDGYEQVFVGYDQKLKVDANGETKYDNDVAAWKKKYNEDVKEFCNDMGNKSSGVTGLYNNTTANPLTSLTNYAQPTLSTWTSLQSDLTTFSDNWDAEKTAWQDVLEHYDTEIANKFSEKKGELSEDGIDLGDISTGVGDDTDDGQTLDDKVVEAQNQFKNAVARALQEKIDSSTLLGVADNSERLVDLYNSGSPEVPVEDDIVEEDNYTVEPPSEDDDAESEPAEKSDESITDLDKFTDSIDPFWTDITGWYDGFTSNSN